MEFNVGERLRNARKAASFSQRALAERAGVPHGQISMIEKNRHSPSVASLRRILGGIPMTMGEFFEPGHIHEDRIFFTSHGLQDLTSRLTALRDEADGPEQVTGQITLRQVGDARAHNLQLMHERYEPGADTGEPLLEHMSHEAGIVISGEIEVTVGDQVKILKPGDSYIFDSRIPHRFRNVGDRPCEVVSACSPPYL